MSDCSALKHLVPCWCTSIQLVSQKALERQQTVVFSTFHRNEYKALSEISLPDRGKNMAKVRPYRIYNPLFA